VFQIMGASAIPYPLAVRMIVLALACLVCAGHAHIGQTESHRYPAAHDSMVDFLKPANKEFDLEEGQPQNALAKLLFAMDPPAAFHAMPTPHASMHVATRRSAARAHPQMQFAVPLREEKTKAPPATSENKTTRIEWDTDEEWRANAKSWHILLLGVTFDNPRMTPLYVAGCLSYVLSMSDAEAFEHATFAKENDFSILGKWPRKAALEFASKLKGQDLFVRVVPSLDGIDS